MAEITRLRDTAATDGRILGTLVASDLSDTGIRDQAVGLIAAGFETTSAAMAWTVRALLTTAGTWDRARAEVAEVLGDRAPRPAAAHVPDRGGAGVRCGSGRRRR